MHIRHFFNQPILVFNTRKKKWTYILSSIIFITLFLLLYTPFGINVQMSKESTTFIRIGVFIGTEILAIFISLFTFQFIILNHYCHKKLTLNHYIFIFLGEMILIGILHNSIEYLSVYFFFPHEFIDELDLSEPFPNNPIAHFILECYYSILAQIFILSYPFMGCLLYFYITDLKENVLELETEIKYFKNNYKKHQEEELQLYNLLNEKNEVEITLALNNILAFESSNQYVLVYYLNTEKKVNKLIIRTRLKKILDELNHLPIIQCHRSFAINLLNVKQLINNKNKRHLILNESISLKIPVSRTYLQNIKARLQVKH